MRPTKPASLLEAHRIGELTGVRNPRESNLQRVMHVATASTIAGGKPRLFPGPPGRQLAAGSQPSVDPHLA
jgi:hypothetical protein